VTEYLREAARPRVFDKPRHKQPAYPASMQVAPHENGEFGAFVIRIADKMHHANELCG
jgi:hypothetical protein